MDSLYLIKKIKYLSRRGLLELDIIFYKFISYKIDSLSYKEKESFYQLLQYNDNKIYSIFFKNYTKNIPLNILNLSKKIKKYFY